MNDRFIACVVDTLLPGDDGDPPLPRGCDAGADRAIAARIGSDEGGTCRRALAAIMRAAGDAHAFVRAPAPDRAAAVRTAEEVAPLEIRTLVVLALEAYYQSEPVLRAMGWRVEPPQSLGHQVEPLDLALLEQVKARAPMWRKT